MNSVLKTERGFALVESIGTLAFAVLALTGGLTLVYLSFAHLWLKRAAYETSICLSTPAVQRRCQTDLENSTATALPIGTLETVFLSRESTAVKTKLHWRLTSGLSLAIEDRRSLPLIGAFEDDSLTTRARRRFR